MEKQSDNVVASGTPQGSDPLHTLRSLAALAREIATDIEKAAKQLEQRSGQDVEYRRKFEQLQALLK